VAREDEAIGDVGRPEAARDQLGDLALADRYGYWNATPEENAEIGFTVPAPARP
jgi:hypothetical protein